MDRELQNLIRHLQDEKCPQSVLDRVEQTIARQKTPRRSMRASLVLAWTVSIVCLFGAIALWQRQARREAQFVAAEMAAAQAETDRALVVQQTQEAFGYIGQALLRAAVHTENTLLKEAVPPIRNGFELVKNKVNKPI